MNKFKITQSITDRKDESLKIYFKDISKYSLITQEEETELAQKVKEGDKRAEEKLITANLRFVISVAKSYQGRGLELVDLIQEGNLGILEAARKYDPNKGIKFISYAVWWIRQSIMKALTDQCRIIRVPSSQILNVLKINKATEKFEQDNGRAPSIKELEDITGLTENKIQLATSSKQKSVSLESPINDEDAGCLLDVISNPNSEPVDEFSSKKELSVGLEKILNKLPTREGDILRLLFGIGIPAVPHEKIANIFGISEERVRQIQHTALKRIRKQYKNEILELL